MTFTNVIQMFVNPLGELRATRLYNWNGAIT